APGSRANWPLVSKEDDRAVVSSAYGPHVFEHQTDGRYDTGAHVSLSLSVEDARAGDDRNGRVAPPWLADDMPPEPPMLRLVENAPYDQGPASVDPLTDPLLADSTGEMHFGAHLRVVTSEGERR